MQFEIHRQSVSMVDSPHPKAVYDQEEWRWTVEVNEVSDLLLLSVEANAPLVVLAAASEYGDLDVIEIMDEDSGKEKSVRHIWCGWCPSPSHPHALAHPDGQAFHVKLTSHDDRLHEGMRWGECVCEEIDKSNRPCVVCDARYRHDDKCGCREA